MPFDRLYTDENGSLLIKQALGISGLQTNVYSWRTPQEASQGAQIDLVLDRADRCVNICEIKFTTGEYELSE